MRLAFDRFAKQCSMWLKDNMGGSNLHTVTALCEREMYGKYVLGAHICPPLAIFI